MLRRTFLLSATAAVAAPARIRIGFLGVAHSHAAAKLALVRDSPQWELAGVWEPSAARATAEKAGVALVERDRLLADKSVRVIAVESDVASHFELARMALEAGKHVHVEKPPSWRRGELEKLVALARSRKLLLQMGYMWRYHPGFRVALEAARGGHLGDVYMVRGTINALTSAEQRAEWKQFRGGQMFEYAGHVIDPMTRLMGRPLKVTPFLQPEAGEPVAANSVAVFEWAKALGVVTSTGLQPASSPSRAFEILGRNGTALLQPIEPGTLTITLQKAAGPYKAGVNKIDLEPYKRYVGDFEDLARCVAEGKPLAITNDEDLAVQEALLRASGMWGE